ncbi:MAG: hypothetical protein M1834_004806 [Cirrosporium novae-zelandiae]|nr:MAG: hypothetical protein M1834_004806 [Cirrosporium novae-zelandiae]
MTEVTPRINASYLQDFSLQTVRLVGKVTDLRGEEATIDAGGSVTVHLNRDAHISMGSAVEIVGKVQQDLSIKVFQATNWGNDIDFAAIDALIDVNHRCKEIFYADTEEGEMGMGGGIGGGMGGGLGGSIGY